MSYPIDTTIPNAPNDPADDQPLMKDNFSNINSLFSVNHFVPGVAGNGKHEKVEMPNRDNLIPSGLVSGESTLYSKDVSGRSQVFFSPDDTGNEYQLTRAVLNTGNFAFFGTNPGWTFLPGGLIMQYGSGLTTSGGSGSSNGSISFPITFITLYNVLISVVEPTSSRRFVKIATTSTTNFTCWIQEEGGSNVANTFYWTAIGK